MGRRWSGRPLIGLSLLLLVVCTFHDLRVWPQSPLGLNRSRGALHFQTSFRYSCNRVFLSNLHSERVHSKRGSWPSRSNVSRCFSLLSPLSFRLNCMLTGSQKSHPHVCVFVLIYSQPLIIYSKAQKRPYQFRNNVDLVLLCVSRVQEWEAQNLTGINVEVEWNSHWYHRNASHGQTHTCTQ